MKSNKTLIKDIYKNKLIRFSDHLAQPIKPKINISTVVTYQCSLNCPYCNQKIDRNNILKSKKDFKLINLILYEKVLQKMFDEFLRNKNINLNDFNVAFNILGGELSELPLNYNIELINIHQRIIKKYNLNVEITWLSNFTQNNNYFKKIFDELNNFNHKENDKIYNFELLFSIHGEYLKNHSKEKIKDKFIDLFKYKNINEHTCIKIFGKHLSKYFINELHKNHNFNNSFEIGDLNFLSYSRQFKNNYDLIRPVKCYNFNYDITPDLSIINQCNKDPEGKTIRMNYFNFKCNDIKKCNKKCPIGDFEFNVYKKVMKKDNENE